MPYLDSSKHELQRVGGRGGHVQTDLVVAHLAGGLWAQSKLFSERYSISHRCRWRGTQAGAIRHRVHECGGLVAWRQDFDTAELVDISRETGDCPLVEYGVAGS
eukprot:5268108-Pyramimonas_sp.AAC.1